jgi:hypothetical protein
VAFVPSKAIVSFAGVRKVFTVASDKAVEQEVTAGSREGDLVEIVGNLKASQVVTTGAEKLAGGALVSVSGGDAK